LYDLKGREAERIPAEIRGQIRGRFRLGIGLSLAAKSSY